MALRQHTTQFFLWQIRLSSESAPFQLRDKSAFPPSSAFSAPWKIRFSSEATPFRLRDKSAFSPKQRLFNSVKNPLFLQNNAFSTLWQIRFFSEATPFQLCEKCAFSSKQHISDFTINSFSLYENAPWKRKSCTRRKVISYSEKWRGSEGFSVKARKTMIFVFGGQVQGA